MNENKRLIIVGAAIIVVIALILVLSFWPKPDKNFVCGIKADSDYAKLGVVNYKQYQCLRDTSGKNALVVSNDLTKKKKDTLNNVATAIGHSIYYIDTEKIDNKDLKTIKKEMEYSDSAYKKDVILVIDEGNVVTHKEDILTKEDDLKSFLKEAKLAKFVCDATPSEDYPNLGEVTYEQYQCLYESEEPFAIMLSQTTCGYCKQFKPFINEYVGEKNIPLYFIEVNLLEEDEMNALQSSLNYFNDNKSWGTPLTLGIKNKEVVSELSGYTDNKDEIAAFFKEIGLK